MDSMVAMQSEKTDLLMAAMWRAQQALKPVKQDLVNPQFNSKYAGLGAVINALEPYEDEGIVITAIPWGLTSEGNLNLFTQFTHQESQQFIRSLITMPVPKNSCQGIGIAITYGRRYAAQCMGNLALEGTHIDNDGNYDKLKDALDRTDSPNSTPTGAGRPLQDQDASVPTYPFEPWKGKPLYMVPYSTLKNGLKYLRDNLDNPKNAKYRNKNLSHIDCIEVELGSRDGEPHEQSPEETT